MSFVVLVFLLLLLFLWYCPNLWWSRGSTHRSFSSNSQDKSFILVVRKACWPMFTFVKNNGVEVALYRRRGEPGTKPLRPTQVHNVRPLFPPRTHKLQDSPSTYSARGRHLSLQSHKVSAPCSVPDLHPTVPVRGREPCRPTPPTIWPPRLHT